MTRKFAQNVPRPQILSTSLTKQRNSDNLLQEMVEKLLSFSERMTSIYLSPSDLEDRADINMLYREVSMPNSRFHRPTSQQPELII